MSHVLQCKIEFVNEHEHNNVPQRQRKKDHINFQILKKKNEKNEVVKYNCEMDNP